MSQNLNMYDSLASALKLDADLEIPENDAAEGRQNVLVDTVHPEKEVAAESIDDLREILEAEFSTTYLQTTLDRICFRPDHTLDVDGVSMRYTQGFLEAAASGIGMPLAYAYKLEPGLFGLNFEQRKHGCSKAFTVCRNRGVAVNLADADYRPARTVDIIDGLLDESVWKFEGARVSNRGVDLNFVQPGQEFTPLPGDVIETGVRISNSETGFGGAKGSYFSLRLVCTNGAVMADQLGTARWNYDRRVAYATSVEKFRADLMKLPVGQAALAGLYSNHVQRRLHDREVVNLIRRLRGSSIALAAVDRIIGLDADERSAMQLRVRERPAGMEAIPTNLTVWDVHNRITESAQRMDFVRRSRLERIGGGMLSDPLTN